MNWFRKMVNFVTKSEDVQVRTRNAKGQFVGDDKSTPDKNEAYKTVRRKKKASK
mgnify:CR=1 FL=1|jgi:hypothetical protein|tara:strand:+ start:2211 stop:2372 length:162 start_codon:yes stop_codon:yes gene_type:complete